MSRNSPSARRHRALVFLAHLEQYKRLGPLIGPKEVHQPDHQWPVVTASRTDRQPHPDAMGSSAPTRADKIADAIVPDQLDQYLPAEPSRSVARRLERSNPNEPGPSSPSTFPSDGA